MEVFSFSLNQHSSFRRKSTLQHDNLRRYEVESRHPCSNDKYYCLQLRINIIFFCDDNMQSKFVKIFYKFFLAY